MTTCRILCLTAALACFAGTPAVAQERGGDGASIGGGVEEPETIAEIRVHGNHTTPETEILALAALARGEPASAARLAAAEHRLLASGRFAAVEIRRRYRSISNPSEILVVLLVDEHDAVTEDNLVPGPLARLRSAGMWLPILGYADGYGLTYGARVSIIEPFGSRSRLSMPLTWGGERKAAMEVERTFGQVLARASVGLSRRVNPHYDLPDARREITATFESAVRPWLRAGANGRVARVAFGPAHAWHQAAGVQLTFDTRVDPSFPRNAVHATIGLDRVRFGQGSAARASADVRGYAALGGSTVLALRGAIVRAAAPLPPSEQLLLGGSSTLRGYRAGHRAGDGLALVSAEARVPLTSPLRVGRFGVKAFVDAGTTWDAGTRLRERRFERGVGGGVYFGATAVTANVDVAWPETGKPRVHAALGVQF
jgi:outer membrane protein assembly factor BamA